MQAGFAMLEVGFARMKNVGTVVAKVVVNLSIASIVYWLVGFALAFGAAQGWLFNILGATGFAPTFHPGSVIDLPALATSTAPAAAKFFFEFVFCAVSLAIVWGTMLERTKFIVYILFADSVLRGDLPVDQPLALRRRMVDEHVRRAGLRRFNRGASHRRDRGFCGVATARTAHWQVRAR